MCHVTVKTSESCFTEKEFIEFSFLTENPLYHRRMNAALLKKCSLGTRRHCNKLTIQCEVIIQ